MKLIMVAAVRIEAGDTLSKIALALCGDGKRWRELVTLNPGIDPNRIRPGDVWRIPESWVPAVPMPQGVGIGINLGA